MSILVLELKQGETMIVNGATLRFKTRARIELSTQARFMFGKQIMQPEDATTPGRKIYYELQSAYVGPEDDRPAAIGRVQARIAALASAAPAEFVAVTLDQILAAVSAGGFFEALKLARQIIRFEDQSVTSGQLSVVSGQSSTG